MSNFKLNSLQMHINADVHHQRLPVIEVNDTKKNNLNYMVLNTSQSLGNIYEADKKYH